MQGCWIRRSAKQERTNDQPRDPQVPDSNPAIGEAWIEEHDEEFAGDTATRSGKIHHDESRHFPICAEHAKLLPGLRYWKFDNYLLYDDTFEGPRFVYGLTHRPLSYGAQPKWSIIGSNKPHPDFAFGTLEYPYVLSDHDREAYELTWVGINRPFEDEIQDAGTVVELRRTIPPSPRWRLSRDQVNVLRALRGHTPPDTYATGSHRVAVWDALERKGLIQRQYTDGTGDWVISDLGVSVLSGLSR